MEAALQAVSGRLGRFHLLTCSLICLAYVYQSLFTLSYVFTTMRAEHRCWIPECESADSTDLHPAWLGEAVPLREGRAEPCSRYEPLGLGGCSRGAFSNTTTTCDSRVFANKDLSIMTEWDMACSLASDWQLAMVGTANSFGRALGLTLFGCVSDALGRRAALLVGLAGSCVLGTARSFANNYATFISIEFLDPLFYDGIGGTAFIMGMELMPTAGRGAWTSISHTASAMGYALLGVAAWLLPHWRLLLRVLYGSALPCLAAMWFIPESIRWLVSKGRSDEAFEIIERAARMNRLPKSDFNFNKADFTMKKLEDRPSSESINSFSAEMKEFLRSRILVLRLLTCCFCWIALMFVYEGMAVYSVSLAGSRYLNFVLVALVEVPASLITWKLMDVAGRRLSLISSLTLASACCVAYHFLPAGEASWQRTTSVMLGKLMVTIAYTVTYVVSAELFPTRVRQTLYAISATCGRLGSALAPQVPLLAGVLDSLPLLVFGCTCLVTALLALHLPETGRCALPESVSEAEAMGSDPTPALPSS